MNSLLVNRLSNLVGVFSVVLLVAALALTVQQVGQPKQLPGQAQFTPVMIETSPIGVTPSELRIGGIDGAVCYSSAPGSDGDTFRVWASLDTAGTQIVSDTYRGTLNTGASFPAPCVEGVLSNALATDARKFGITIQEAALESYGTSLDECPALYLNVNSDWRGKYTNLYTLEDWCGDQPTETPVPPTELPTTTPPSESPTVTETPGPGAISCKLEAVRQSIDENGNQSVQVVVSRRDGEANVTNASWLEVYLSPEDRGDSGWFDYLFDPNKVSCQDTGACEFNSTAPKDTPSLPNGAYWIACNAGDNTGREDATKKCTGNHFGVPDGWDYCGDQAKQRVVFEGPTPTLTPGPGTPTVTPPDNTPTPTPDGGLPSGQSFQLDVWAGNVGTPDPNAMCYIAYDSTKPQFDNHNNNTYEGSRRCESQVLESGETRYAAEVKFTNLKNEPANIAWQTASCYDHGLNNEVRECHDNIASDQWGELQKGQTLTATWEVIPNKLSFEVDGETVTPPPSGGTTPAVTPTGYPAPTAPGGEKCSVLEIVVEDISNGNLIEGASITLDSLPVQVTNSKGRVYYEDLSIKDNALIIKNGYKDHSVMVDTSQSCSYAASLTPAYTTVDAIYEINNLSDKEISYVYSSLCRGDIQSGCLGVSAYPEGGLGRFVATHSYVGFSGKEERVVAGEDYWLSLRGCNVRFTDGSVTTCSDVPGDGKVVKGGQSVETTITIDEDGNVSSESVKVNPGRGTQISDLNYDGYVDGADVAAVVASYGAVQGKDEGYNPRADFCGPNGDGSDGFINAYEVSCLIRDWNPRR